MLQEAPRDPAGHSLSTNCFLSPQTQIDDTGPGAGWTPLPLFLFHQVRDPENSHQRPSSRRAQAAEHGQHPQLPGLLQPGVLSYAAILMESVRQNEPSYRLQTYELRSPKCYCYELEHRSVGDCQFSCKPSKNSACKDTSL